VARSHSPSPTFSRSPNQNWKTWCTREKSHSYGHAHICRYEHAIQHQLADQSQQKAAGKINQQRSVWKNTAMRSCTTPCKPYRASVPMAPNSAIKKYLQAITPSHQDRAKQHKSKGVLGVGVSC